MSILMMSLVSGNLATILGCYANISKLGEAVNRAIWSGVEPCIAIICACLPTIRPVIKQILYGDPMSSANSSHSTRWTRNITARFRSHENGSFNRLEQPHETQGGLTSINRKKPQAHESYMMTPITSPKLPDNVHSEESGWLKP